MKTEETLLLQGKVLSLCNELDADAVLPEGYLNTAGGLIELIKNKLDKGEAL